MFSENIANRMNNSPHRKKVPPSLEEFLRPTKPEFKPKPEVHFTPRKQTTIKELKAQMGRLLMDNYAPLHNKDHTPDTANKETNRLAELESAMRQQRQEMNAAKSRLRTLEEEPFVLYCSRTHG